MKELSLKISNTEKHISQKADLSATGSRNKMKMAKAAKEFESLFTSMMIKNMTKTTNGFFGEDSFGGDFFDTIFEQKLAEHISNKHSMGIADMLYKKFTGENLKDLADEMANKNAVVGKSAEAEKKQKIETAFPEVPALKPSSKSLFRINKFESIINKAAEKFNLDKNLIKSVILTESAGNETAKSSSNAKGLMQLMDPTALDMGVKNVWDPKDNINGGTKYLAKMIRQYRGDLKLSLAAYNAGSGNVDKYKGIPPFTETKNYVSRVLGYYNYLNG